MANPFNVRGRGLSVRRLLKSLDATTAERKYLLRVARNRAAGSRRWYQSNGIFWMAAIFLSFIFVVGLTRWIMIIWPAMAFGGVELLVNGGWAVTFAIIIWWWFDHWETPKIRPSLMQVLHERGYRFCRSCSYDLRELPTDLEECPECGTYITQRSSEHDEEPPILEHRTNPMSRIHEVVRGGTIPVSEIERALVAGRERYARTKKSAERSQKIIGIMLTGLLAMSVSVALSEIMPSWLSMPAMITGIVFIIAVMYFWLSAFINMRIHNKSIRAARQELRRAGHEICINCGKYLGDFGVDVTVCPLCDSPRALMPEARSPDDERN